MSYIFNSTINSQFIYTPIISTDTPTTNNTTAPNILISTGNGTGTGNGGDINITPGNSSGTGTQGGINFISLGASKILPINEPNDLILNSGFTATSIVGALNELKGTTTNPIQQSEYSSTDLYFNGTTPVNIPNGYIDITSGDWYIGYDFVIRTSAAPIGIEIYVEGTISGIIPSSYSYILDNGTTQRHTISRPFILNAASDETLQLKFKLISGTATSVAIETDITTTTNPDQIVVLWGFDISSQTPTITEYAGADVNYNGNTLVDIDTITLTGGTDWLVSYTLTLQTPTINQDAIILIRTAANVVQSASTTKFHRNTTGIYYNISKSFILTSVSSGTTYKLSIGLDGGSGGGTAVDTSLNTTPIITAFELSNSYLQTTYNLSNIDWDGTNEVPIGNTISLLPGVWLVGYSLSLNTTAPDLFLTSIINNDNYKPPISKSFAQSNDITTIQHISRNFGFSFTDSKDFDINIRFDTSTNTGQALNITNQTAVLYAYRVGDIPNNNTFISLNDTPGSYSGAALDFVRVKNDETGLEFTPLSDNIATGNNNLFVNSSKLLQYGAYTASDLTTRVAQTLQYIYLPPGTFSFASGISIATTTIIYGSGDSTIISLTGDGITWSSNIGGIQNCKIQRISPSSTPTIKAGSGSFFIDNVTFDTVASGGTGHIDLYNTTHCTINNCRLLTTTGTALFCSGSSSNINIINSRFDTCTTIFNSTNTTNYNFNNNTIITSGTFTLTSQGIIEKNYINTSDALAIITVSFTSNVIIENNYITNPNTVTAINLINSSTNINVQNNVITTISLGNAISCSGTLANIQGNNIISCGSIAIYIDSNSTVNLNNNYIRDCYREAIYASGIVNITGNTLNKNATNTSYSQLYIDSNASQILIENNTFIPITSNLLDDELISISTTGNDYTVKVGSNNAFKSSNTTSYMYAYNDKITYTGTASGTLSLPNITALSAGHRLNIINNSSNALTLTPTSASFSTMTIDASTSYFTLIWDGTRWCIDNPINTTIAPTYTFPISNRKTSANTTASGAGVTLSFATNVETSGITYSAGVFTIIYPGIYSIQAIGIIALNGGPGLRSRVAIYKNGTTDLYSQSGIYVNDTTLSELDTSINTTLNLNRNDTIRIIFTAITGSTPFNSILSGTNVIIIRLGRY